MDRTKKNGRKERKRESEERGSRMGGKNWEKGVTGCGMKTVGILKEEGGQREKDTRTRENMDKSWRKRWKKGIRRVREGIQEEEMMNGI